jgi:uncharacterized protein (UPF0548 family)
MKTLHLRKPTFEALAPWLADQANCKFSYQAVGATASSPPPGFIVDRTRIELGSGERVFRAATSALRHWEQFQLGWVDVASPKTPIEVGQVVAVLGWAVGFWWLNCCRIIYTVDEVGPTTRFGFAYGTLPSHVECGEERFLIEWDRTTDKVFYDIMAFSRPNHILTRLGYPFVRLSQKRFGRDSATAMFRAAQSSQAGESVLAIGRSADSQGIAGKRVANPNRMLVPVILQTTE